MKRRLQSFAAVSHGSPTLLSDDHAVHIWHSSPCKLQSDCFDVPVGCPAASTVVRLWRSSARHDKTPCFGFWVRRAFLGLLHSKSLTFTILLTSHYTFELNKLPHQYKLSIVYERGIKKEGKLLMWEK